MGSLFYLMTFLAQHDPTFTTAADTTRRALLETTEVKRDIKAVRRVTIKRIQDVTGLTPQEIVYAAYVYPVIAGKISTKPFKNFKYRSKDRTLALIPEVEYRMKTKEVSLGLFLIKEF